MKISKIDNVLKDTQNILNYPQKVVDDVVLHVFESLADYVKYPTKAGFRIQH